METWFIFAMVSLIFSGLHIFTHKVGAVRKYNSNLINGLASGVAGVSIIILASLFEDYSSISWLMIGLSLIIGIVYLFSSNLRIDSFHYIDTTIALPIHKFVSPLFALFLGIILFDEDLTIHEWLGIILGILVPLLLISKNENNRQKDLKRGIILIIISAILSSVGVAIYKFGVNIFSAILLFAGISNLLLATSSLILHRSNKSNPHHIKTKNFDWKFLKFIFISGIIQMISFSALLLSFSHGGSLAVVYTITSLYIVIPIILSVIFYNEHWNTRKVVAIVLSILAVGLMG